MEQSKQYVTLKEMSSILGVSRVTAKKILLKAKGEIKFSRLRK